MCVCVCVHVCMCVCECTNARAHVCATECVHTLLCVRVRAIIFRRSRLINNTDTTILVYLHYNNKKCKISYYWYFFNGLVSFLYQIYCHFGRTSCGKCSHCPVFGRSTFLCLSIYLNLCRYILSDVCCTHTQTHAYTRA